MALQLCTSRCRAIAPMPMHKRVSIHRHRKANTLLCPSLAAHRWRRRLLQAQGLSSDDLQPDLLHEAPQVITFVTSDGIVRLPGNPQKRPHPSLRPGRSIHRMPTFEEQQLCIGASFYLAATNGYDPMRRINYAGFCQSVDYLWEAVEDTVLSSGGSVLWEERQLTSGVHEVLKCTVAIPFLWGVPPQLDSLSFAIKTGGGIVEKVYHQWGMYPHSSI